jgi:ATP-dependent DNA helicase RecG
MDLTTDIQYLPGVGPKRATVLKQELGVTTIEDLLSYYPYKYIDRSRIYFVHEIDADLPYIQLKGKLRNIKKTGQGRSQRLSAMFYDTTGQVELIWFKGIRYVEDKLKPDAVYIVFGKPTQFKGHFNIAHPEIDIATSENQQQTLGWQALYNTSESMKKHFLNSTAIRKIIHTTLKSIPSTIPESLPDFLIQQYHLMPLREAIINIHFPQHADLLKKAQHRLKFEELFYIQLSILRQSKYREIKYKGLIFSKIDYFFNTFYKKYLPFELTGAQKRVLKEIRQDVGSGKQMNRLLQGDVGSGKTLVALLSMLMAIDNGFQACIMAPTEILATQHYETISEILGDLGVKVALLTGSTKKSARADIHAQLLSGELKILIGTHALIEDIVVFKNLGLVVIDEQHRFGVAQRAKLWNKNTQPPHVLVMTATPIPRTLAMTVYGDLEVSVIDELPPGRKSIETYHYYDNKRVAMLGFLKKQIDAGRQIYIVYPLIQESEKIDLRNLEEGYVFFKEHLPQYKISMVHGKMKPAEKDDEMKKFASGETQIMVATTVIEVGVNVPNASVMVIESAERFGLSQLHQLRGRVGRGAEQSYCILLTSFKITTETKKRMEILVNTNDGFEISEADLQMRGPGDMDGTTQSGMPFELKIANLAQDGHLLSLGRKTAMEILDKDPSLETVENRILASQLQKKTKNAVNWSVIS